MMDFHRHDDGQIYLSVMTPLIDREDHDRPLGVLTLKDLVEELTGELARYELTPDKTKTSGQKSTS